MPRLTVNQLRYHVDISGEGTPILLLHGFTGDTTIWELIRNGLEISHQVITIDILGHGQSDNPDDVSAYRMERVACDILELMDALSVAKAHLLGYSMGGRLALHLAIRFPDRFHSLILESASPGLKTEAERNERRIRDNTLADKIEANGIEWFVEFWENLPLWDSQKRLPKAVLERQRKQRLSNNPNGLANSLRGMGTGVQPSLWDNLANLTLPVQLIVGEHDAKFIGINREMADLMPQVDMQIMPNAGHTVHLENPTAFSEQVKIFLESVI